MWHLIPPPAIVIQQQDAVTEFMNRVLEFLHYQPVSLVPGLAAFKSFILTGNGK